MIRFEDVHFTYPGSEREILSGVSVGFERGYVCSIMGPSGTGKTTLLRLAAGMIKPDRGSVGIDGQAVDEHAIRKHRIAYISQDYLLFPYMSAADNIIVAMDIWYPEKPLRAKRERARELLDEADIGREAQERKVEKLSGGERQRTAIARALALEADYILADEPTGNLDAENGARVADCLKAIAHERNACVLVVTHSDETSAEADIIYRMERGKLCLRGDKR